MERYKGEDLLSYAERLNNALELDLIGYKEWANDLIGETLYSDETLRRCSLFFDRFLKRTSEEELSNTPEDKLSALLQAKVELEKERMKLLDEKREYNNDIRRNSRNDLFSERLESAINRLEPIKVSPCILTEKPEVSGVLVVSDLHYDSTYTLNGIYGEVVNQYNKDICKGRMERLISLIEADDIAMDELTVVFNGDLLEGVLRASSLVKLTQPVIDSTIELSEFISQWIVKLQEKVGVPVKVAIIGGNHGVLRPLMSKPIDDRENLEKIIQKFVELRLSGIPDITIEPYGDAYFATIQKNNILFLHGENSDLANTMSYYENYYDVDLDYCVAGHYHRGETKTVGVGSVANKEVIRVPSVCGTDGYAKKLNKNARAGATFMLFTENGRDWSKNYCLN